MKDTGEIFQCSHIEGELTTCVNKDASVILIYQLSGDINLCFYSSTGPQEP